MNISLQRSRFACNEETGGYNITRVLTTLALILEKKTVPGIANSRMSLLVADRLVGRRVRKDCLDAVFSVHGHLIHLDQWVSIQLNTGISLGVKKQNKTRNVYLGLCPDVLL